MKTEAAPDGGQLGRSDGAADTAPDAGGRDTGAAPDAEAGTPSPQACPDLFDPGVLQDFAIDISASEWAAMQAEFMDVASVLAGQPRESYHPIVFHRGAETVGDAAIRLKGQSSWVDTVMFDQPHPKMQFVVAFDEFNPQGQFHGVGKLVLDMPRADWTFLHERLATNWFRQVGVMAPCSNSAKLTINGAYYGLYVNEEHVGHRLLQEFFPTNPDGDLYEGGEPPSRNTGSGNEARRRAFWAATNIASVAAIVDLPHSLLEWAGEALINDADGYYSGSHNFYIFDQGAAGYAFTPKDTDSSFDWLGTFGDHPFDLHPIYWWAQHNAGPPGQHWVIVMNDPTWRARYADAIATQVGRWDVQQMQSWIDTWSAQIADAVKADPNKWATFSEFQQAVGLARQVVAKRPEFLRTFVACEHGQGGADMDGDGYKWCDDCRDDLATAHPGAPEICGNGIDDNCNGAVDEGCPAPTPPDAGAGAPDAGAVD